MYVRLCMSGKSVDKLLALIDMKNAVCVAKQAPT